MRVRLERRNTKIDKKNSCVVFIPNFYLVWSVNNDQQICNEAIELKMKNHCYFSWIIEEESEKVPRKKRKGK